MHRKKLGSRWSSTIFSAGLLLVATGCMDIRTTRVRTTEEVLSSVPRVSAQSRFQAESSLVGTVLRIQVTPRCDEVSFETVEVSDISDKHLGDDEVTLLTLLALVGAVPLGTGTGLLADAPNVYASDPNARLYNATGQDAVIATGVILTSVGLAASLPPLINGLRAVGTTAERRTIERQGPTLRENVPCGGAESARMYNVTMRIGSEVLSLGMARPNDPYDVDLIATVVPRLQAMSPPPRALALWIDERFQREFPVEPLLAAMKSEAERADDAAWLSAEASACAQAKAACAGVQDYLSRFPNGLHSAEARKLLTGTGLTVASSGNLQPAIEAARTARENARAKAQNDAQLAFEQAVLEAERKGLTACKKECAKVCVNDSVCKEQCGREACR
jgi:hypothetical protein